jgi:hypothetical protein
MRKLITISCGAAQLMSTFLAFVFEMVKDDGEVRLTSEVKVLKEKTP